MHILVATGGSTHSHIALEQSLALAKIYEIKVTILTVIEQEEHRKEAEVILAKAATFFNTAVSSLITKVRMGDPAAEISAEAKSGKFDLLILGERSHHNLLTRLMGPTAQRVISQTTRPVLLAKQHAHAMQRILICDSGFQTPTLSDRLAAHLPELLEGAQDVTILHVMSQIGAAPGVAGQHLRAEAQELMVAQTPEGEWLTNDLQTLQQVEVAATPKVRHGLVVEEILAEAFDGRYDLIVIGAHPHEGWQRFLLEDVSTQIVVKADRPVLVIP